MAAAGSIRARFKSPVGRDDVVPSPRGRHTQIEPMMTMSNQSSQSSQSSQHKHQSGFTLAEVLLASVLGAMLLTALTLSTYGFTQVLSYHEVNAGVTQELDPILRVVTRDIREAQWAELEDEGHIKLADHAGLFTEYFFQDNGLWIKRPNGDTGEIYHGLTSVVFSADYVTRKREGAPADIEDGTLYTASTPESGSVAFEVPSGAKMALSFVMPVYDVDAPGYGTTNQQFTALDMDILRVPLHWIPGTGANQLNVTIYDSWAPGHAKPLGSALGSVTIPGSSLPQAVWDVDHWVVPSDLVSIGIWSANIDLEPGGSYTAVLQSAGNSRMLYKAYPTVPVVTDDLVAMATSGNNFVTQPLLIKREVSGDATITTSTTSSTVHLVSIYIVPVDRPAQTRSAALLSQAVSGDPWLGVLPGEVLSN